MSIHQTNQFISRLTFGGINKRGEHCSVGIGIGIGVAIAVAIGFCRPIQPIATAIATPIPIPMFATPREHDLFMRAVKEIPSQRENIHALGGTSVVE